MKKFDRIIYVFNYLFELDYSFVVVKSFVDR